MPGDPCRILPKLRVKEIEESIKKLKLDGCFSSKQCLPSSREGGFITQVKGEDYANCYGIESVLKYVNVSHGVNNGQIIINKRYVDTAERRP